MDIGLTKKDFETSISKLLSFNQKGNHFEKMKSVKVFLSPFFALVERYTRNLFFSNIDKVSKKEIVEITRNFPSLQELLFSQDEIKALLTNMSRIRNICAHIKHKVCGISIGSGILERVSLIYGETGKVSESNHFTLYGLSMILGVLLPKEDRKILYGKICKVFCNEEESDKEKTKLSQRFDRYTGKFKDIEKRNPVNLLKDLLTNENAYKSFKILNVQSDGKIRTRLGNAFLRIATEIGIEEEISTQIENGSDYINYISKKYENEIGAKDDFMLQIKEEFAENEVAAIALVGSIFGFGYDKELIKIKIENGRIIYKHDDKINAMLSMALGITFCEDEIKVEIEEKSKRKIIIKKEALAAFIIACEYTDGMSFIRWLISEKINDFSYENMKCILNSKLNKTEKPSQYLRPKNYFIGQEDYWVGKDSNFQNELKEFFVTKFYPELTLLCMESEGYLILKRKANYKKDSNFVSLKELTSCKSLKKLRIIAFHNIVPKDILLCDNKKENLTMENVLSYINKVKNKFNTVKNIEIAGKIKEQIQEKLSPNIKCKANAKYKMYEEYFELKSKD